MKEEPTTRPVADLTPKPKKFRLECKDCGQKFDRRETFNLHRHFHAHEDDLAPLTCKECGLTFQHRSSFIKHRNEHREKEEALLSPKIEPESVEEGSFQCAECAIVFSTVEKLREHNCHKASEKPYHCPLCRQDFQVKISITRHMATHSQECLFRCQECSQTFYDILSLHQHQRAHAALKPYKCPECGMAFRHYSVMEDHRRKHTDGLRSHLCTICGKSFKYSSLLHQHRYLHTGKKPFRCNKCGKTFAFAQNMKAHSRQHRLHKILSSNNQHCKAALTVPAQEVPGLPGKENTEESQEQRRLVRCRLCPETFGLSVNFRAHMMVHEAEGKSGERAARHSAKVAQVGEQGHLCPHCPSVFQDEHGLNRHLLSSHNSVTKYLENMSVSQRRRMSYPKADRAQGGLRYDGLGLKSHKCPECQKVFRHRSVLMLHMRVHSKDKPYQCKVCGKCFRFSSYLQQHVIIHTGKKPYKCPDCGRDFAFLQNMKTHQKLHQEKPFKCTNCSKGYRNEGQLKRHMISHKGERPHKCEQCSKSFQFAHLLRDHMNTHTGEKPHRCEECPKSFTWFSSLLVHQKIHARELEPGSGALRSPAPVAGARSSGVAGRGRRGGRLPWLLPRPSTSSVTTSSQSQLPSVSFSVSDLTDAELHRGTAVQLPSSALTPWTESLRSPEVRPHHQPVQWKVDGGEIKPVPSSEQQQKSQQQQQRRLRSSGASASRSDPVGKQGALSTVGSHLATKKSLSPAATELEQQRQRRPVTRSSTSSLRASTSAAQPNFSTPSYVDGAALWSVRPVLPANSQGSPATQAAEVQQASQTDPSAPQTRDEAGVRDSSNPKATPLTVSKPEKPQNGSELQKPVSAAVSLGVTHITSLDLKAPAGMPKTNCPDKVTNNQDGQLQQQAVSSAGAGVQSQTATQKVPISIQYDPHHVGQALGTTVWGFQTNAVGPQALLAGQIKLGSGQELQQQPMVTSAQIIINQTSPFFSPPLTPLSSLALSGAHPLHAIPVGALSRAAHPNIFFAPQAVMSERPHMPQTLPLAQLAVSAEPQKLGPPVPFLAERLLQCMICGCSFPRELDLQMHYLQHAQAKI